MSVQFQSANWRALWFWTAVRFSVDVVVFYIIIKINDSAYYPTPAPLLWAFVFAVFWQIFKTLIRGWDAIKSMAIYLFFIKETEVDDIVSDMLIENWPVPDFAYANVSEYLLHAVLSTETSDIVKLKAGRTLGELDTLKQHGPVALSWYRNKTIENAIKRYSVERRKTSAQ